jgi:hypothetical protein
VRRPTKLCRTKQCARTLVQLFMSERPESRG